MDLNQLKQERNKLLSDMQAISLKPWTTESRTAFDKMNGEVTSLDGDIARSERAAALDAEQRSFTRSPRHGVGDGNSLVNMSADERKDKTREAFRTYARNGVHGMTREQRDLVTINATGQALIPQMYDPELISARKYFGRISTLVRQRVTNNNGAPLKVSLSNDVGNGLTLLATEGTSSPAETDPAFQSALVGCDTVSAGLVKVSFQELEDSSFDLDSWIRDAFGLRYARGLERSVTLGVDSAGTTLPNQTAGGLAGGAVIGTTTASLAAGIGWDDMTAAVGALDPAYTNPAKTVWQFNSSTRAYLLGLKDGFGRGEGTQAALVQ
jgi:HK97 family phage major capsid protein